MCIDEMNIGKNKRSTDWRYLTEKGVFHRQDDHHGDVVSAVRHLQQLHLVVGEVLVPELGLLVHHFDGAGPSRADLEVRDVHVVFVELVLPLTLREEKCELLRFGAPSTF